MDYTYGPYKHRRGIIFTAPDSFKYNRYKAKPGKTYLQCVLYQNAKACKGSAKLETHSNIIIPLKAHNHPLSEYRTEVFVLKSKCVSAARSSRDRLSKVFKQVVRGDPAAVSISCKNLETAMYRARREIEPHIPGSPAEFCQLIQSSQFGIHYKGEVQVGSVSSLQAC